MSVKADFLRNRTVTLSDGTGDAIKQRNANLGARSFFVTKLADAKIAEGLRAVCDEYAAGKITGHEAKVRLRQITGGSREEAIRNLGRRARAELILNTQRNMAAAAGQWAESMNKDAQKMYPFIRYHTNRDGFVRDTHRALDGKVFAKDDPFLRTHWPGAWDYNCRCYPEELTLADVNRAGLKVEARGEALYTAESGYGFDPSEALEYNSVGGLDAKTRKKMISDVEEAIRRGVLKKIGLIAATPDETIKKCDLSGLSDMSKIMKKVQPTAQKSADSVGFDPAASPDWKSQYELYTQAKSPDKDVLPKAIEEEFGGKKRLGSLDNALVEKLNLPGRSNITLEVGNSKYGLAHNWVHHKEVFVDPAEGEKIIRQTLGNPNCRVTVSLGKNKNNEFVKKIVFFDPASEAYCITLYDGENEELKIVSYHRAPARYGERNWVIKTGKRG